MKKLTAIIAALCLTLSFICPMAGYADTVTSPATQGSTTITTTVPDTHKITVAWARYAGVSYKNTPINKSMDVPRHEDIVLTVGEVYGYTVTKFLVDGVDVTDKLVNNTYTIPKIYHDVVVAVEAKDLYDPPPIPQRTPTPAPTGETLPVTGSSPAPSATPDVTTETTPSPGGEINPDDIVIIGGDEDITGPELEEILDDMWDGWSELDDEVMPKPGFINPDGTINHNGKVYNAGDLRYTIIATVHRGGKPVEGLHVELCHSDRRTQTDEKGMFTFEDVTPGRHTITIYENGKAVATAKIHLIPHDEYGFILHTDGYIITIPVDMDTVEWDIHIDGGQLTMGAADGGCNLWWLLVVIAAIIAFVVKKRKNNAE